MRKDRHKPAKKEKAWLRKSNLSGGSTEEKRKVLEYVCHRVGHGARLRDVMQEGYVRRNASADEIQTILDNPRLIQTAHEKMREDFYSGKLDPKPSPSSAR